jgi:membrane protein
MDKDSSQTPSPSHDAISQRHDDAPHPQHETAHPQNSSTQLPRRSCFDRMTWPKLIAWLGGIYVSAIVIEYGLIFSLSYIHESFHPYHNSPISITSIVGVLMLIVMAFLVTFPLCALAIIIHFSVRRDLLKLAASQSATEQPHDDTPKHQTEAAKNVPVDPLPRFVDRLTWLQAVGVAAGVFVVSVMVFGILVKLSGAHPLDGLMGATRHNSSSQDLILGLAYFQPVANVLLFALYFAVRRKDVPILLRAALIVLPPLPLGYIGMVAAMIAAAPSY